MHRTTILLFALFTTTSVWADETPDRWAEAIAKFAADDAKQNRPTGGIVFTGSSSIRLWDLPQSFPELDPPPLNRGFGGSQFADIIRHIDRLILRHKPRVVVLYSGDNDLAAGKKPSEVLADFRKIASSVREQLPETRIVVLAPKPSSSRWKLRELYHELNKQLAAECTKDDHVTLVDTWPLLTNEEGSPDDSLFKKDRLHLNEAGYAKWNAVVRPLLNEPKQE